MTNEFINLILFLGRDLDRNCIENSAASHKLEELESIKSLNDNISIQDVIEVYLPLISLIQNLQKRSRKPFVFKKYLFKKRCK